MRENPVFSLVLKGFVQEKQLKKRENLVGTYYMRKHNKVLGYPTEIFDFVLDDGSNYSLFT